MVVQVLPVILGVGVDVPGAVRLKLGQLDRGPLDLASGFLPVAWLAVRLTLEAGDVDAAEALEGRGHQSWSSLVAAGWSPGTAGIWAWRAASRRRISSW